MAIGMLAAVAGQEEASLLFGGVGAVIYLYSRYIC